MDIITDPPMYSFELALFSSEKNSFNAGIRKQAINADIGRISLTSDLKIHIRIIAAKFKIIGGTESFNKLIDLFFCSILTPPFYTKYIKRRYKYVLKLRK